MKRVLDEVSTRGIVVEATTGMLCRKNTEPTTIRKRYNLLEIVSDTINYTLYDDFFRARANLCNSEGKKVQCIV